MITWQLFISFVFISERISKHPKTQTKKDIPEDKQKQIQKHEIHDQI